MNKMQHFRYYNRFEVTTTKDEWIAPLCGTGIELAARAYFRWTLGTGMKDGREKER